MPKSIYSTEINKAPALRISHIVRGRTNEGGRVRYLVDPEGHGLERAIPEDVVLIRWRRRMMDGHSFHGCRLGPNLWRAIAKAFGAEACVICGMDAATISIARAGLHQGRREHHLWLPDTSALIELFWFLGSERLQEIIDRHLSMARIGKFGTPDLFLFARSTITNRPAFFRLVEVKKPGEPVSSDQHEEIAFLRSIGVPARVLRLIER